MIRPLVEAECPELVRKQPRFMVELTTNERQVWMSILGLVRFDDDGGTSGPDLGPKAVAFVAENVSVDTAPDFGGKTQKWRLDGGTLGAKAGLLAMEQLSQIIENSHFLPLSAVAQTLLASCIFATGLVKHPVSGRCVKY
jgi:hypothetical protein